MTDWVNDWLDGMDDDIGNNSDRDFSLLSPSRPPLTLAAAKQQADRGNIRPLCRLYPELKKYLGPPKLKRGQRRPENPFTKWGNSVAVRNAIDDVWRIRLLWKWEFGKRNRPRGDRVTAEGIAAARHGVAVDDIARARKLRKKSPPR
jgi:hypothetical protein